MSDDPLELRYPVVIRMDHCTDGSPCYVAEHPDLPGCAAHSESLTEARQLLESARVTYLRHLLAKALPPPMPSPFRPMEWQSGLIDRNTQRPRVAWETPQNDEMFSAA